MADIRPGRFGVGVDAQGKGLRPGWPAHIRSHDLALGGITHAIRQWGLWVMVAVPFLWALRWDSLLLGVWRKIELHRLSREMDPHLE